MRKTIIAAGIFLVFIGACATPQPAPRGESLHSTYRGTTPAPGHARRYAHAHRHPRHPVTRRFHPSWYPKGRRISP
ncbi:MAG: hypothetical protein O7B81_09830, partial [Gammaproteobacteria bacterium]|nr:hypothetical protein [Gammaproteobacteria bacterium]